MLFFLTLINVHLHTKSLKKIIFDKHAKDEIMQDVQIPCKIQHVIHCLHTAAYDYRILQTVQQNYAYSSTDAIYLH